MNPGPPQYLVTLINFLIFVYIKKMVKFFLEKKLDMNIIKVLVSQQQQSYLYQMKQNLSKLKKKRVNYVYGLNLLLHILICSLGYQKNILIYSLTINLSI